MGYYNPHRPHILGEEWVPIRNVDTTFSPNETTVELGHRFTTASAYTLNDARFYIREMPADTAELFHAVNIYAAGTADQSGPIRNVIIPVDAVATTGAVTANGSPANGAQALLTPALDFYYSVSSQSGSNAYGYLWISFNTAPYNTLLSGKRILDTALLFGAASTLSVDEDPNDRVIPLVAIVDAANVGTILNSREQARFFNISSEPFGGETTPFRMGNVSLFSSVSLNTDEYLPWTYDDLNRFDAGASSRIYAAIGAATLFGDPLGSFEVWYAGLQVTYCEEKRLYVGGWQSEFTTGSTTNNVNYGANVARMRSWQAKALNPSLPAGTYDITLSTLNWGDFDRSEQFGTAQLRSTRELYPMPLQPGLQVNVPFPAAEAEGETLTEEATSTLLQLSLHTSGAALVEVHSYGSNLAAQVYGSITATQDIYDTGVSAGSYPWVRFYARRFGDTTVPLTLTGAGGLSGSTAAITVAEFDELEEVVDGWKEIDLRFSSPPTMGGVTPSWIWSATGETAGNRWEVLGAAAPAISGLPGNLFGQATQQLYTTTYEPPSGSTVNLTWMPQGIASPYVSGAADDNASDAVIIFAMDPPAVSGFAGVVATQAVTGIGEDCGLDPCGIPTGIDYVALTWTPISSATLSTSGFGAYEIQRSDEITDWETIMMGSSVSGAAFNDYEARTDMDSYYRIRVQDVYGFYGAWSSTVTVSMDSPGLDGGCLDHVMIFTSNQSQSGAYNLAYSMAWEGRVSEDFSFPEAGGVQYQPMYNRDYFTAFHSTERGGTQFTRDVLVQAAAIAPETLEDFTGLRDMAWANLNYVCVRDEEGNRWFASITVPTGRVQHFRRIYMAQVNVVEVTDTPTPVDPWS